MPRSPAGLQGGGRDLSGATGAPSAGRQPEGWVDRLRAGVAGLCVGVAGRKHPGTARSAGQGEIFA